MRLLNLGRKKTEDKMSSEFITVAAHKLRTPLTRIKWGVTNLKEKLKDYDERALLNQIELANEQLIKIADVLLETAGGGTLPMQMGLTDLGQLTQDTLREFSHDFNQKGILVSHDIPFALPAVLADKEKIREVISALLHNALSYTKKDGHVQVQVTSENAHMICKIEDTGIGITLPESLHIFELFYRSERAILTDTEGLGLSLYLARKIIEKHGGQINFKSGGENKGSAFWFTLPKARR